MQIDDLLRDRVVGTSVPALAVGISQSGSRSFAHGYPSTANETPLFRIASLTKPFTPAATVLALQERGIPLSTPAIELLPALAADWEADPAITVEQLLGQVAGLRESVDSAAVAALGDGSEVLADTARLVVRAGSQRAPGERWSYYNGNYFLVGAVLAAVAGTSYERALARTLLQPWQLGRTGFDASASSVPGWDDRTARPVEGYPRGRRPSGGLWSCVTDLIAFAEHLLGCAPLLEETRRPRTRTDDPMGYGLGWALGPDVPQRAPARLPRRHAPRPGSRLRQRRPRQPDPGAPRDRPPSQ